MTPRSRPPRWLWRVLLLLPGALCWAMLPVVGERPLLSKTLAHRFHVQVEYGFLLIGAMPDFEPASQPAPVIATLATPYGTLTVTGVEPDPNFQQLLLSRECIRARQAGFSIVESWPGATHIIIADWLVAVVFLLLALPFLNAIRLTWRRSSRKRHNRCLACGYSLQALTTPRCPECGLPFELPTPPPTP